MVMSELLVLCESPGKTGGSIFLTIPETMSPEVKRIADIAGAKRAVLTDITSDMFRCIHPAEHIKTPTKKAARNNPMADETTVGVTTSDDATVSSAK